MPPKDDVVDETTVNVSDKTGDKPSGDKPTDGDDKGSAAADAKPAGDSGKTPAQLEAILEKYGLGGAEDLEEFIGSLSALKDKVGANDIEELLQNKKELQKIQTDFQRAEEARRRESETPEETIQRLEAQLHKQDQQRQQEQIAKQREAEDAKLIKSFNTYVSKSVEGLDGYSKAENAFLKKYLGVNNPIHDIELTDTAGIKKLITTAAKDFDKLKDAIIEDYEKHGKRKSNSRSAGDLPDTPRMDRAAEPGSDAGEKHPQNMRDARAMAKKQLISQLTRR